MPQSLSYFRAALWLGGGLVLCYLILPIVIIVPTSFNASAYMDFPPRAWSTHWYANFFSSRQWTDAAWLSLQVAVIVMIASTVLGTAAALGIAWGRFPGRQAVEYVLLSPMVVPVIVFAIGLYFLFARLHLVGKPIALYLGHTVLATPLVIVIVASALRAHDRSIEHAARSLGAGYFRTLWEVTIPLIRPAILSGAAFAFLASFDEVLVAIFVGGPAATTLPKRMWDNVRNEIDPTLTAISSLLVLGSVLLLGGVELVRRASGRNRSTPTDDRAAPAPGRA
jgi:ABC-type spermidine/putrescine transport system permease subunit II